MNKINQLNISAIYDGIITVRPNIVESGSKKACSYIEIRVSHGNNPLSSFVTHIKEEDIIHNKVGCTSLVIDNISYLLPLIVYISAIYDASTSALKLPNLLFAKAGMLFDVFDVREQDTHSSTMETIEITKHNDTLAISVAEYVYWKYDPRTHVATHLKKFHLIFSPNDTESKRHYVFDSYSRAVSAYELACSVLLLQHANPAFKMKLIDSMVNMIDEAKKGVDICIGSGINSDWIGENIPF